MRKYLRVRHKGGTYFFTVVLAQRHGNTMLTDNMQALGSAFRDTRRDHPFEMPGFVVLPDHLHCLWRLPPGDDDFSLRWRLIKSRFSRLMEQCEPVSMSRQRKKERGIWQRRFWETSVRDEVHFSRCLDYLHYNPVKHGLAPNAIGWAHSSFRTWVAKGVYSADWASAAATWRILQP